MDDTEKLKLARKLAIATLLLLKHDKWNQEEYKTWHDATGHTLVTVKAVRELATLLIAVTE